MNEIELQRVISRMKQGEEEAFLELCEVKGRDILYVCYKLLQNMQDAEDITQEILAYIHGNIHELKHPEAFRVWLYKLIKGRCLNMMRTNGRITGVIEKAVKYGGQVNKMDFLPDDFDNEEQKRKAVINAIDSLSVKNKLVIFMFYFEGMKYQEIAKSTGTTRKSVEYLLITAKREINQYIEAQRESAGQQSVEVLSGIGLAAYMEWELEKVIRPDTMERVIAGTLDKIRTAGHMGDNRGRSGKSSMVSTKVIAGISLAGGLAAVTLTANYKQEQLLRRHDPASVITDQQLLPLAEIPVMPEEEQDIRTLEDMIGWEAAVELRMLAVMDYADPAGIESFLSQIDFSVDSSIWDVSRATEYVMYSYEKRDKRLTVIIRQEESSEDAGIAYCFMGTEGVLPREHHIRTSYEEWKGENQDER